MIRCLVGLVLAGRRDRPAHGTDVTYAIIDEMEPIYEGLACRARAELGVTAWGIGDDTAAQLGWVSRPQPDATSEEADQEDVYIPPWTAPR